MDAEDQSIKGRVAEVGLVRDEGSFNSFNLTIAMVLKSRGLTYDQGERLMTQFRKELLGKDVEITAIVFPCPTCGKGFNTEQGMKQHIRMVHEKKKGKPRETKVTSTRKRASKRGSRKK